jgi:hypothetical protein
MWPLVWVLALYGVVGRPEGDLGGSVGARLAHDRYSAEYKWTSPLSETVDLARTVWPHGVSKAGDV